jgi:DNA modification methylase
LQKRQFFVSVQRAKSHGKKAAEVAAIGCMAEGIKRITKRANARLSADLAELVPGVNTFSRDGSELHPTVKPIQLVVDAILDSTKRNDIVLDPFLGSGTTLLAAERTGRRCYGIELDPLYVDTAIERWQRMSGRKAHSRLGETYDMIKDRRKSNP